MLVKDESGQELVISRDVWFAVSEGVLKVDRDLRTRCENIFGVEWCSKVVDLCTLDLARRYREQQAFPANLGSWFMSALLESIEQSKRGNQTGLGKRNRPMWLRVVPAVG